jgi:PAS domain S-box-containing protein
MQWSYEYTPYIWPYLTILPLFAVLGFYAFRHHAVPGAFPFVILTVVLILWSLANAMEQAATIEKTKIYWFKVNAAILLPLVIAALCFSIEYAGLGKWLNRWTLTSLTFAPVLFVALILTNDFHHLVWKEIVFNGHVDITRGLVNWVAVFFAYFLSALQVMVLAWLFVRSPRHRWIALGLITTPLIMHGAFLFRIADWNPLAPLDPMVIAVYLVSVICSLAFFRFHMFDVVPIARDTIIEKMPDGMMVLDSQNCIADLNPKAESLFGLIRSKAVGRHVGDVLSAYPELIPFVEDSGEVQCELSFGFDEQQWYKIHISPFIDRRGFKLGRLILFYDITGLKMTQNQLLLHQRTLAMMEEREILAREIHDDIAQTLAAAHLQARSLKELLAKGDMRSLETCLQRLVDKTKESNESVRDFLLGVKSSSGPGKSLIPALRQYLDYYRRNCGIQVEFIVLPELEEKPMDLSFEAQLQRIIQEALTNVRKHSGASSVRVIFDQFDNQLRITIEDSGMGFDPDNISESDGFGLRAMQGRTDVLGGWFKINSKPGKGTQLIFQVPLRKGNV